jgi:hypothetical protein
MIRASESRDFTNRWLVLPEISYSFAGVATAFGSRWADGRILVPGCFLRSTQTPVSTRASPEACDVFLR